MLDQKQKAIHSRALYLSKIARKVDAELVEVLQQVDASKTHRQLGHSSLFVYVIKDLKLSESYAYALCAVARAGREYHQLGRALNAGRLSLNKASRIVSVITRENVNEVVAFAEAHSTRETQQYVARLRPRAAKRERVRAIAEDLSDLHLNVSNAFVKKLDRARELQSRADMSYAEILDTALTEYLERHDPLEKARRASVREARAQSAGASSARAGSASSASTNRQVNKSENDSQSISPEPPRNVQGPVSYQDKFCARRKRVPLTAGQKHAVTERDRGQCTHVDARGQRCTERRWLKVHHIRHVSQGGDNTPENLTTLCSAHHDLVHQLTLPLEYEFSWLREPVRLCRAN